MPLPDELLEKAREIFPKACDRELESLIWEHSSYPFFFIGDNPGDDPFEYFINQLKEYRDSKHE
jgi:hypothetical protein